MEVMLCCIGRKENQYIREFIEYYKDLGINKICLFDNNYDGEDDFHDVIGDYIDEGYVILKDYRNKSTCQLQAYQECYDTYGKSYDWIAFFDIDEFLTLPKCKTISEYLSNPKFNDKDCICINWMCYGDNGLVHNDGRKCLERFTQPLPFDKKIAYNIPEDLHVKSIVKGNISIQWKTLTFSHAPYIASNKYCNADGESNSILLPFSRKLAFDNAYIRHFSTKTAEEYSQKMLRGFPDSKWDKNNNVIMNLLHNNFFRYNEITPEKIELFKDKLGIDLSYLLEPKDKDVKIYTLCYTPKHFSYFENKYVTPLQVGADSWHYNIAPNVCDLKDNTGDNISGGNYFYVENTGTYWIWKNVKSKYKGQMQYRRILEGIDDKTDFASLFDKYDVITCKPFHHPDHNKPTKEEPMFIPANTVREGYAFSNCNDDLTIMEYVVKLVFPDYREDWDKYINNGENLYYSNGFIMSSENYDKYAQFLFTCLNTYLSFANIHNEKELYQHVKYNIETGKYIRYNGQTNLSNDIVKYQTRIGGYLSERIFTLWLLHNFPKDKILEKEYIKQEPDKMYT